MAEQTEKAFQKQPKVFLCPKKTTRGSYKPGKGVIGSGRALALVSRLPRKPLRAAVKDGVIQRVKGHPGRIKEWCGEEGIYRCLSKGS